MVALSASGPDADTAKVPPEPDVSGIASVWSALTLGRLMVVSNASAPEPSKINDVEVIVLLIATVSVLSAPRVTLSLAVTFVKVPLPGVVAPIETRLAAPAPEIFQFASLRARSVPVVRPMVIVPVLVPVPILVLPAPEVLTSRVPPISESVPVVLPTVVLLVPVALILPVPDRGPACALD